MKPVPIASVRPVKPAGRVCSRCRGPLPPGYVVWCARCVAKVMRGKR
jgi:hypothetical protein